MGSKTGVLLINLGSPDSPSIRDVRKYLRQFFSDPHVIDIPWINRQLLKYFIILPFRSPKSAALYRQIWTESGSPLVVYGELLKKRLQSALGNDYAVETGMGYGNPSIKAALRKMQMNSLKKLVVIPLFPQYATSTTGSVTSATRKELKRIGATWPVTFAEPFYDHTAFINAWSEIATKCGLANFDHILFSYHGLPERHIIKNDQYGHCLQDGCCNEMNEQNRNCYRAQCFETTRLIANRLNLNAGQYSQAFQSRLGKVVWLKPYTANRIEELAKSGVERLLVIAPSFVADCLETLQEIAIEHRGLFVKHGGEELTLCPGLNDHPAWVAALEELVKKY